MKVYIASSFNMADTIKYHLPDLINRDIFPTVAWWNFDYKSYDMPDEEWYKHPDIQRIKSRNFKGIVEADAIILWCPPIAKKFNGANIEVGYALALDKPVFSIGALERSAMYTDLIKCSTINELIKKLKEVDSNSSQH